MRGRRKSRQLLLTEFVQHLTEPERRKVHELAAAALSHVEASAWHTRDAIRCAMVLQSLRAIISLTEPQPQPKEVPLEPGQ